jgi:hypothetical protein
MRFLWMGKVNIGFDQINLTRNIAVSFLYSPQFFLFRRFDFFEVGDAKNLFGQKFHWI